jgi:hypothetical protein
MMDCQRRMGPAWRPDRALTNKILHLMEKPPSDDDGYFVLWSCSLGWLSILATSISGQKEARTMLYCSCEGQSRKSILVNETGSWESLCLVD